MNWTHFLLWVAGIYGLYYLTVILLDFMGGGRADSLQPTTAELTFSEHIVPEEAGHTPENDQGKSAAPGLSGMTAHQSPEVIYSGGVLLKDVFSLARKEVIVYTRQVSF